MHSAVPTSTRTAILLGLGALLWFGAAHAQLYKWVDKDGKVHYTDKPPPGAKSQVIVPAAPDKPKAAPVQAHDKSRTQATFTPEEREALSMLCGIQTLQGNCSALHGRPCTFDELVGGIPGRPGRKLARDPRNNPSYGLKLGARRDPYVAAAEPRRDGLSGFLATKAAVHYNTRGSASTKDAKVQGGVSCKDAVKQ